MYEYGILIDVSHMDQAAIDETFAMLAALDNEHGARPTTIRDRDAHGHRFGEQAYMLSPATIERIAERDGVIGLILAQHQLNETPASPTRRRGRNAAPVRGTSTRSAARRATPTPTSPSAPTSTASSSRRSPGSSPSPTSVLEAPLERCLRRAEAAAILSGNAMRVVRRILARRG